MRGLLRALLLLLACSLGSAIEVAQAPAPAMDIPARFQQHGYAEAARGYHKEWLMEATAHVASMIARRQICEQVRAHDRQHCTSQTISSCWCYMAIHPAETSCPIKDIH